MITTSMSGFPTEAHFDRLAARVLDASLPKIEWTHEAHFALALWILRRRPESCDPESFRAIITSLNEAHGTPNTDTEGYHHTITVASIGAANSVLHGFPANALLAEVLANLMTSRFANPAWILEHWSRETLFSAEARRSWVAPDIRPLPW